MRDESPRNSQSEPSGASAPVSLSTVAQLGLDALRAVFPNWRINGSPCHWFAVRGGFVAHGGPRSLLHCYLSASTLLELAEKLGLQEYLDGLSDQELADVWHRIELPRPTKQAAS
jgi:hypothetical protein